MTLGIDLFHEVLASKLIVGLLRTWRLWTRIMWRRGYSGRPREAPRPQSTRVLFGILMLTLADMAILLDNPGFSTYTPENMARNLLGLCLLKDTWAHFFSGYASCSSLVGPVTIWVLSTGTWAYGYNPKTSRPCGLHAMACYVQVTIDSLVKVTRRHSMPANYRESPDGQLAVGPKMCCPGKGTHGLKSVV